ncbi:3-dehydroquinate synthase [Solimicrobium silvestre]|uniref:3-dehydroquinate synthetase n=1 Tax=Solimicrobium silvestre TaxID=2099400 RepID=A0A2S9H0C9_9BURK|nr:3-dehydroquinate synthase [Solimicrobium silvestre]PRC93427.1 3-dehydroquinate synthetase [Solimicrobium silvestre]
MHSATLSSPTVISEWQQQRFQINYAFPVISTRNIFSPTNLHLKKVLCLREKNTRHRVAIFIDSGVLNASPQLIAQIHAYAAMHADVIEIVGDIVLVPGGESCKNDDTTIPTLLEALSTRAIDRHSYTIAIGGGAVLDAVGYAAAIFHRGVRHIRLPSTVLAQADSGVGVKNAVNWEGKKNLLGCFAPPWAVINDGSLIDALPEREKIAGMAEAVKVGLIRDRDFFEWLENNVALLAAFDSTALDSLISHSAMLHMRQIAHGGDPFEMGSARPLDFGHWAAHKMERLSKHALSHGEAVAIGIALDTRYSYLRGLLTVEEDQRIYNLLKQLGFTLWHPCLLERQANGDYEVLRGLTDFQEHLGGELSITLLAAIGAGIEVSTMDHALIAQAITDLQDLACN